MSIEAMKQALRALEKQHNWMVANGGTFAESSKKAIFALEKAIEQAEKQEPVIGTKTWFEDGKVVTQHLHPSDIYTRPVVHAVRCTYPQCQATNGCVGACSKTAPVHASDISAERVDETAKGKHEPIKLRRGNLLRCIETDELCTVWATSTSGKTLVHWGGNDFTEYTVEQIGELFWLEPEPSDVEIAAEQSDNYAAFIAGVRFARVNLPAPQKKEWVSIPDWEIHEMYNEPTSDSEMIAFAREFEAKLKEKNT